MIPALAFNEAVTTITTDLHQVADHYAATVPKINDFTNLSDGGFKGKASTLKIGDLVVHASSHTRTCFERVDAKNFVLLVPIEGYSQVECAGSKHTAYSGSAALFSTSDKRRITSEGSALTIQLDIRRLTATFASVLARDEKFVSLEGSRTLPIEFKNLSFLNLFRELVSQIDCVNGNLNVLEKLAFDDRVYRLSAGLIYPNLLLSDEPVSGRVPHVSSELDMLCEYISATLKTPISLTQMEQMSGLSARNLQYAFKKQFGMGAREWLRRQRLHAARSALLNKHEQTSIAFVAYDFCFLSPSEFSRHYKHEFGELPEQTLRRGRYQLRS